MNDVALVIMSGGSRSSGLERLVTEAREAAVLDTVERALEAPSIARIIVASDSERLADMLAQYPVKMDMDSAGRPFHFGRRLTGCIERYHIERLVYVGAGSAVLASAQLLDRMATIIGNAERSAVVNNFFSTDYAGWTPADCIRRWPLPEHDNGLGWILGEDEGLPTSVLDRNGATQFDIDTPIDLLLARGHPALGSHLRGYLDLLSLDGSHLERARSFLFDGSLVIIAGRVAAETWGFLEKETPCRFRVFAEERGMRSDGRLETNEVRSLLGFLMQQIGIEATFERLAELGHAAFIDSRVLWAHFGRWPAILDRFRSDLGLVDDIEDAWLRRFTAAALGAPIPIVLGGHSLVSGGLYALVESARHRAAIVERAGGNPGST